MMIKKTALKVVSSNKNSSPYDKTRHNAVKHGVLSHVSVLPWEQQEDLEHLKQGFLDDFRPQGATEIYLAEELATLAFRKQRLYKAEDALIAQNLDALDNGFENLIGKGNPIYPLANLMSPSANIEKDYRVSYSMKNILYPDHQKDGEDVADYRLKISQYEALLNNKALTTYQSLLDAFPDDLVKRWLDIVKDNSKMPDIETLKSLQDYLKDDVLEPLYKKLGNLEGKDRLRQQAVGMAYIPDRKLQSLQRYEVTLDRLFERKLSTLVKLQDIRRNKLLTIEA
jgi:hypothetical protein